VRKEKGNEDKDEFEGRLSQSWRGTVKTQTNLKAGTEATQQLAKVTVPDLKL
jgi:hypothetical protein